MSILWLTRKYREKILYYLNNYITVAEKVAKIAEELLGDAEVYVFGSVVENDYTVGSDLDILIISKSTPSKISERARIIIEILRRIDLDAPIEIHLIKPDELGWYKRFIKKMVKVYPRKRENA